MSIENECDPKRPKSVIESKWTLSVGGYKAKMRLRTPTEQGKEGEKQAEQSKKRRARGMA